MTHLISRLSAVFAVLVALCVGAAAGDLDQVKARMKERVPAIEKLKDAKIVGEDNRGYLAFVGARKEKEDLVRAENDDRKSVYTAIAAETGTTEAKVGQRRALKIAEIARPGTMIQTPAGTWEEKK